MKTLKRIALGILILLALLIIIGFSLFRHISIRAIPDYDKNVVLKGLHTPVEVYRDSFAIPHIYAQDEHDLYLATGYLLAQDRLWQMDMLRRVAEGRLSEIFGASYVETDLLLRALRFRDKSDKMLTRADSLSLVALNAFADGVNQYIDQNSRRLPPEFAILRYKPEKWEPQHSLNMVGYMAWDLKAGWSEIILTKIKQAVDSVRYQQLLPDLLRSQPTVYPVDYKGSFSAVLPDQLLNLDKLKSLGADVLEASNNWAVSGRKSITGKPLLANDMHLGLNAPGIWYQIHQVIPGKLNVTGLALPGTPVIICGHNDSIAWGMTNTYVDNMDFYKEKINPQDSTLYEYNGEWRKFNDIKTVIKISSGDQEERTIRFSHRGPVVSSFKKMDESAVTMHWAGDEDSDEFSTIMALNRAGNWNEFKDALRTFKSISQNIVYADVKGNIGLFCAAGVPVRKRDIPFGILPGHTDEYDWKGFVPFDELPYSFNPPHGYVASANNRTVPRDYPHHIGTWYALPGRYERITELLSGKDIHTIEDFKQIQLDQHSKMAEKYLPHLMKALEKHDAANEIESRSLELLKAWDYKMETSSAAATIFDALYLKWIQSIFADELGETLFNSFNAVTSVSRTSADQLIENRLSPWFDDVSTENKIETFDDRVAGAFSAAIAGLVEIFGNDPGKWEWGKVHTITLSHPLSAVKALDRTFNLSRGPYPVGGSFHTVAPFNYSPNKPFIADHGASQRSIFDLGNWDTSITVIPTGNSGIPSSRHYCDQTELYMTGRYHRDHFSKEKVVENKRYYMKFE